MPIPSAQGETANLPAYEECWRASWPDRFRHRRRNVPLPLRTGMPCWQCRRKGGITSGYRAPQVADVNLERQQSGRHPLLRDGKLHLSLQDAIALAASKTIWTSSWKRYRHSPGRQRRFAHESRIVAAGEFHCRFARVPLDWERLWWDQMARWAVAIRQRSILLSAREFRSIYPS